MSDLKNFKDEELRAELERREALALDEVRNQRIARNRLILAHKGMLLNLLEHSRTSCDDENPSNGFVSSEYPYPRCAKCALIKLDEYDLDEREVNLTIEIKYVE